MSNVTGCALVAKGNNEANLWHLCYGYLNITGLKLLCQNHMVICLPKTSAIVFCEGCVLSKQRKISFPSDKSWRASGVLELVHADLCGPMKTESLGGTKYFLLFIDDYSLVI